MYYDFDNRFFFLEEVSDNKLYKRAYLYIIFLTSSLLIIIFAILLVNSEIKLFLIAFSCVIFPVILFIMVWDLYWLKSEIKRESNNSPEAKTDTNKNELQDPMHYILYRKIFLVSIFILSVIAILTWIWNVFIIKENLDIINIYFVLYWIVILTTSFYVNLWLVSKKDQYASGIQIKVKSKMVEKEFLREIKWISEELNMLKNLNNEDITKIKKYSFLIEKEYSDLLKEDFYEIKILEALEILKTEFYRKLKSILRTRISKNESEIDIYTLPSNKKNSLINYNKNHKN